MSYRIWKIIRSAKRTLDKTEKEPVVLKIRFNGDGNG